MPQCLRRSDSDIGRPDAAVAVYVFTVSQQYSNPTKCESVYRLIPVVRPLTLHQTLIGRYIAKTRKGGMRCSEQMWLVMFAAGLGHVMLTYRVIYMHGEQVLGL